MLKAFTLLESLVVLFITSLMLLLFTGGVESTYRTFSQDLFFLQFEAFYLDSQKLAAAGQTSLQFSIQQDAIKNGQASLSLPQGVDLEQPVSIHIDAKGGNSDLQKVVFTCRGKTITYQLNMGNGKFKKKET